MFGCGSSQRKGRPLSWSYMKYVVIGGAVLWVLFCVARSLIVASHRADEQLRKFMQNEKMKMESMRDVNRLWRGKLRREAHR